MPEADQDFDPNTYKGYLNIKFSADREDAHPMFGKVTKRLKDHRGNPIGTAHTNPIMDTRMYEVEFADGQIQAMSANLFAENMFASVDKQGHRHLLIDSIIDHRKTAEAVSIEDAFVVSFSGNKRRRETTKGWEILI